MGSPFKELVLKYERELKKERERKGLCTHDLKFLRTERRKFSPREHLTYYEDVAVFEECKICKSPEKK